MITATIKFHEMPDGAMAVQRELPPSTGSPKELAYAENIRAMLDDIITRLQSVETRPTVIQFQHKEKFSVHQEWAEYLKCAYKDQPQISRVQFDETQQAFFSGAFIMFNIMNELGGMPEEMAVGWLAKVRQEVILFLKIRTATMGQKSPNQ